MQRGVSRGIFSNEAGLGTGLSRMPAPIRKACKTGCVWHFEVFVDTIVICTLTALVILCSGTAVNYGTMAGADLTISGFTTTYGSWASIFSAVALCCFAFSTIIGWAFTARVLWNFCSAPVRPCARSSSFIRSSQSSAQPSTLTCCGTSPIPLTADEYSESYRVVIAFRHGGEADKGIFCERRRA